MKREKLIVGITHDDLDGVMSAVVTAFAIEQIKKKLPWYSEVQFVPRFFPAGGATKEVICALSRMGVQMTVTDLSISHEEFNALTQVDPFIPDVPLLVDHHRESECFESRLRTMVSMKNSGTMNCLQYYSHISGPERVEFPSWLFNLAKFADDYDMWRHAYPESRELNALVAVLGPAGLYNKIMDERENFSVKNIYGERWLQWQKSRLDKAQEEAVAIELGDGGVKCVLVPPQSSFLPGDSNELADRFAKEGFECFAYIYGVEEGKGGPVRITLRSKEGGAREVMALLKEVKGVTGGGHDNACGVRLPASYSAKGARELLKETFRKFIEKKLEQNPVEEIVSRGTEICL